LGDCFRNQSFKAHQIHGAMGFTWDCDLQLFIRRGKAWELQLGSPNQHRESILKQLGL
jgi:alkylation response protein AidB-like acyl-CoA dehydrogenase